MKSDMNVHLMEDNLAKPESNRLSIIKWLLFVVLIIIVSALTTFLLQYCLFQKNSLDEQIPTGVNLIEIDSQSITDYNDYDDYTKVSKLPASECQQSKWNLYTHCCVISKIVHCNTIPRNLIPEMAKEMQRCYSYVVGYKEMCRFQQDSLDEQMSIGVNPIEIASKSITDYNDYNDYTEVSKLPASANKVNSFH